MGVVMSYKCFEVSIENKIAHIVLTRPEKRNSMIPEFWDELPEIVEQIDAGAKARVIVISSTGPHFTAGLDLQAFFSPEQSAQDDSLGHGAAFYSTVQRMQHSFSVLENCRIPVLAAIQGGCIGGGVDLSTACDMRYGSEDAYFTIQETNIGMTADVGTFPRILNLMPEGIARELAYTGRKIHAQEAMQHGLLNSVYETQEAMLAAVMEIAAQIAAHSPLAVYGCKRIINYSRDHSTADSLDYIGIWNASNLQPEIMMEAMAARAQKRPAEFSELPPMKQKISS
ncbi:MAG: crotonase/enoyl-CoA hydratase family protein [Gammaproteobacteria bacterium]|nr:crotonase/enoyl-CoA hydratase family protein [Gammaproteobacteria bacterium]